MNEYCKIDTVFERSTDGSKKLIPGKFRNKTVEYLANNHWLFTEKINGINIRIIWDGYRVTFEGRTDNADLPLPLLETLANHFQGETNEELFEQKFGKKKVILYGEGYGLGIKKGGLYRPDMDFILFDVMIEDIFLSRNNVEDIARTFNIDIVPILGIGTIEEGINLVMSRHNSTIGTAVMEGIVAKPLVELKDNQGNRVIVKIKAKDF